MIKTIMKDIFFLNQKSQLATELDGQVIEDLLDTLKAHDDDCVGMAANMIGIKKRIIAINISGIHIPMINPVIVNKSNSYETEEGCLSLTGVRKTLRYKDIEVEYQDIKFMKKKVKYSGYIAQIIQHEVDHCNGIVI